ncbi:hypothetical protein [Roseovarius sp. Pro17]|uniref:hypothetical protein n=1 Tax=Roseovarius sp. Pro17 TaxID=3108175 RepID=UPI002D7802C6|nr:hypothetical protein [Roseovarius sp. Pro17]
MNGSLLRGRLLVRIQPGSPPLQFSKFVLVLFSVGRVPTRKSATATKDEITVESEAARPLEFPSPKSHMKQKVPQKNTSMSNFHLKSTKTTHDEKPECGSRIFFSKHGEAAQNASLLLGGATAYRRCLCLLSSLRDAPLASQARAGAVASAADADAGRSW